jgi:signal transduction histidine kinase
VDLKIFPVWEKEGRISKFIEVSRDISDSKKAEEEMTRRLEKMVEDRTRELKETHSKLLHQDKMASLGKLSASVVHEINNPISGILSLVMLMNRIMEGGTLQQKDMAQFSQYLKLMETETRRISRIVSNMLAFSRHSKMEFGILNLNQLIEKTLFLNANLLKLHSIKLDQKFDPHLPDLMGSEDRLQQVFMNLISNAAEALESRQGERILTIETQYLPQKASIAVSVRDTGVGIPPENIPRLFEPFFSTKKKGKGVGLGLSVVYGIIQEHGGSIQVQSEAGKWTTFSIELPLKTESKVFSK